MHGTGKIEFLDHTIYEGFFVNGNIEGQGIEYIKGSNLIKRYQGNWLNGLYNGKGVYYHANGKPWYTGNWRDGVAHGHGILYFENGSIDGVCLFDQGQPSVSVADGSCTPPISIPPEPPKLPKLADFNNIL